MKAKRYSRVLNPYWTPGHPDDEPPESEWMKIDVDKYWGKVLKMDFESELIREMADHYFWQVMLEHFIISEQERKKFSKHFFTKKAIEGRSRAIHGLIGHNRLLESHLIDASNAVWGSMFEECPKLLEDDEGREWDEVRIGDAFVRLIACRDHKAFKKISDMLKQESDEPNTFSNYSKVWRKFCKYVCENQQLPTKLTFNRMGGFLKSAANGTKARKELGLSGLPD